MRSDAARSAGAPRPSRRRRPHPDRPPCGSVARREEEPPRTVPRSCSRCRAGGARVALAGCGGSDPRQDENEASGDYPVQIVSASFPRRRARRDAHVQRHGPQPGDKAIPNLAMTVDGFNTRIANPDAPTRPPGLGRQRGPAQRRHRATSGHGRSASCPPASSRTFAWQVTATRPGTHTLQLQGRRRSRRQGPRRRRRATRPTARSPSASPAARATPSSTRSRRRRRAQGGSVDVGDLAGARPHELRLRPDRPRASSAAARGAGVTAARDEAPASRSERSRG